MILKERDPNDEWMWKTPLTPEELAGLEEESRFHAKAEGIDFERYTCKDCSLRTLCTLAFDDYNTDGDCLLEK